MAKYWYRQVSSSAAAASSLPRREAHAAALVRVHAAGAVYEQVRQPDCRLRAHAGERKRTHALRTHEHWKQALATSWFEPKTAAEEDPYVAAIEVEPAGIQRARQIARKVVIGGRTVPADDVRPYDSVARMRYARATPEPLRRHEPPPPRAKGRPASALR